MAAIFAIALAENAIAADPDREAKAADASGQAELLAEHFHRPAAEISALHAKGLSYPEIAKILLIARMSKRPVADLLERNRQGHGWGAISRELGLNPIEVKKNLDETLQAIKQRRRSRAIAGRLGAAEERIWEIYAVSGVTFDNNIRHLLVNSLSAANPPLPDSILRSGTGLTLTPRPSANIEGKFSYAFDRYDYLKHPGFSYYSHSISADLYPRISSSLSLDAGADFDWTRDKDQGVGNSQDARAGIIWRAPRRLRLEAGYSYRNDVVSVNHARDTRSNIAYFSFYQRFLKSQLVFGSYRYRASAAAGPDFSYKSHTGRLGIVSHWASFFKTTVSGSLADKRYDNMDSRFLQVRRDKTYSAIIRPALTLWRVLEIFASFTYLQNRSNVAIKSYADQIHSLGLEVRF